MCITSHPIPSPSFEYDASQICASPSQVVTARRLIAQQRNDHTSSPSVVVNVVFMGMGEPMNNLSAVLPACAILTHPLGLQFSPSKVTVSTVGLVPQIHEFMAKCSCELAVSLHATSDDVRGAIMPVNTSHNLSSLLAALEKYFPKDGDRSVCLEYVMLQDVNDSLEDAKKLVDITKNISCTYNLIAFNPFQGTFFVPSTPEVILKFRGALVAEGKVAPIRHSRGGDQMAACGQLGGSGS